MPKLLMVVLMGVSVAVGPAPASAAGKEITVTPAEDVKWRPLDPKDTEGKGPQISVVFGELGKKAAVGLLLKVPAGFRPPTHTHTSDTYVMVLKGTMHNFAEGADEGKAIGPGGWWFQPGRMAHEHHCEEGSECVLYWYVPNGFDFKPVAAGKP